MSRLIEVQRLRGSELESQHKVMALILNDSGNIDRSWGEVDQMIFPRSSVKLIQALPLVLKQALQQFHIPEQYLALACASHNGDLIHTSMVLDWLNRLGLAESDLECGVHPPMNKNSEIALAVKNQVATQVHNNCSGKHCGFLTLAKVLGAPTKNYIQVDHPVQIYIRQIFEELMGESIDLKKMAIDGCSIPTYFISILNLAKLYIPFINQNHSYSKSAEVIKKNILQNPTYIAGQGRLDTSLIEVTNGNCLFKIGAEGVYMGFVESGKKIVVLKVLDGSSEIAQLTLLMILKNIGALSENQFEKLQIFSQYKTQNWNNIKTGQIKFMNLE